MRIGLVTEYFPKSDAFEVKGGAEAAAFNEARYLAKRHEVTVITSREPGVKREDNISGVKVIRCGMKRKYVQSGSFFSRSFFMHDAYKVGCKLSLDILVGYNFITYPVAWKISRKLKVPCVARYHDVWIGKWTENIGLSGFIGELLERYTLSRDFDMLMAVSHYTKDKLEKYFDRDGIAVVPNIVDVPSIEAHKFTNPTVCCISRLVEYKRVDDLIKAVAILKKNIPDIKCKIVGTGPKEAFLKKLARDLGVFEEIEFCGFLDSHDDVLKTIKSSHVFCLPSVVEGFGIVIIEAMACGVPFVASNIPPLVEASNGKGGLFFEPRNHEELAEKIDHVLSNQEVLNNLKKEGKAQSRMYRGDKIVEEIENIYQNLIQNSFD